MVSEVPLNGSRPAADQGTAIHVYTLLMNAGLSKKEVREVGDELWRRVKVRVAKMAASADAEERLRYCGEDRISRATRNRINQQIVGEEFLAMRFSRDEMERIEEGLRLGLTPKSAKTGRRFANVIGLDGQPQQFEVLTEKIGPQAERVILKDTRTGQCIHVDQ